MSVPIYINLACEDDLSEAVLRKILSFFPKYTIKTPVYGKKGFGDLKRLSPSFHNACKSGRSYLLLTDLDNRECAPTMIRDWIGSSLHKNFLFRVAVREVETWLLADLSGIADFLGVSAAKIPVNVEEEIPDPKQFLVNLARRSKKKTIREDIIPADGSTAPVGRNYNGRMKQFVYDHWDVFTARTRSNSLDRLIARL